jgi:hypothetical protein
MCVCVFLCACTFVRTWFKWNGFHFAYVLYICDLRKLRHDTIIVALLPLQKLCVTDIPTLVILLLHRPLSLHCTLTIIISVLSNYSEEYVVYQNEKKGHHLWRRYSNSCSPAASPRATLSPEASKRTMVHKKKALHFFSEFLPAVGTNCYGHSSDCVHTRIYTHALLACVLLWCIVLSYEYRHSLTTDTE